MSVSLVFRAQTSSNVALQSSVKLKNCDCPIMDAKEESWFPHYCFNEINEKAYLGETV